MSDIGVRRGYPRSRHDRRAIAPYERGRWLRVPSTAPPKRNATPMRSADLGEQATDLENQEALEAIGNSEIHEIHQVQAALKASPKVPTASAPIAVKILTPNV
jgi:hypothetical protein